MSDAYVGMFRLPKLFGIVAPPAKIHFLYGSYLQSLSSTVYTQLIPFLYQIFISFLFLLSNHSIVFSHQDCTNTYYPIFNLWHSFPKIRVHDFRNCTIPKLSVRSLKATSPQLWESNIAVEMEGQGNEKEICNENTTVDMSNIRRCSWIRMKLTRLYKYCEAYGSIIAYYGASFGALFAALIVVVMNE